MSRFLSRRRRRRSLFLTRLRVRVPRRARRRPRGASRLRPGRRPRFSLRVESHVARIQIRPTPANGRAPGGLGALVRGGRPVTARRGHRLAVRRRQERRVACAVASPVLSPLLPPPLLPPLRRRRRLDLPRARIRIRRRVRHVRRPQQLARAGSLLGRLAKHRPDRRPPAVPVQRRVLLALLPGLDKRRGWRR